MRKNLSTLVKKIDLTEHVKSTWSCVGKNILQEDGKNFILVFYNKTLVAKFTKDIDCQVLKKLQASLFLQFIVIKQLILPNCRSFYSSLVLIEEDVLFFIPLKITCRA